MSQNSKNFQISTLRALSVVAVAVTVVGGSLYVPTARADRFQEQINALSAENAQKEQNKNILGVEASSLTDAINKLQVEIDSSQAQINHLQGEVDSLKKQIAETEEELAKQRKVLGNAIKTMYVEGDISTVEMLATSKDLSDFFDKQQYRESVQNKVKRTLDQITKLKLELNTKREQVEVALKAQQELRNQLAAQRAEKDRVLGMNQAQQGELESQIKANSGKIAELKRQQILENQRLRGGSGGGRGVIGGGRYPWGSAPCLSTGRVDGPCYDYEWGYNGSWLNPQTGYAYRNCTDWVAWRGGFPRGLGNAADWPGRAARYGLSVSDSPVQGAAAVNRRLSGYGHVMYVEAVHGDGSITVSDYNGNGDGKYDTYRISAGNARSLEYVH